MAFGQKSNESNRKSGRNVETTPFQSVSTIAYPTGRYDRVVDALRGFLAIGVSKLALIERQHPLVKSRGLFGGADLFRIMVNAPSPPGWVGDSFAVEGSYLVDPASSHMLVSKIKPCMSKYKQLYSETANGSLNQL